MAVPLSAGAGVGPPAAEVTGGRELPGVVREATPESSAIAVCVALNRRTQPSVPQSLSQLRQPGLSSLGKHSQ